MSLLRQTCPKFHVGGCAQAHASAFRGCVPLQEPVRFVIAAPLAEVKYPVVSIRPGLPCHPDSQKGGM